MYYIYKMCHTPTGRVYIGQRKVPKGRTPNTDGYRGSGTVWKLIYKAHPDECVKTVLEVVESKEEANALEKKIIAHYRSVYGKLCVNIADGGGGCSGFRHSEATKQKMSEAARGEKNPFFGRRHSEETKRKIGESEMGEKHPRFGKPLSEEHRRKVGESKKGNKYWLGRHHSEETKRKIGEASKNRKKKS